MTSQGNSIHFKTDKEAERKYILGFAKLTLVFEILSTLTKCPKVIIFPNTSNFICQNHFPQFSFSLYNWNDVIYMKIFFYDHENVYFCFQLWMISNHMSIDLHEKDLLNNFTWYTVLFNIIQVFYLSFYNCF